MSGAVDRLVPSVEDAARLLGMARKVAQYPCVFQDWLCPVCEDEWRDLEGAALAYDMARAQESDARRAESARLRAEVAW